MAVVPMGSSMEKDWLVLLVVGCTGGVSVLAMLGVFANIIRYESQLHTLRNRVTGLQYDYALRLARLQGQVGGDEEGEVDIVDEPEDPPAGEIPGVGAEVRAAA